MRLPLADWKCSSKERKYINEVLDSGWISYGPFQKKLERMWSSYHDCRYGVINSSGTSALQLAFRACKELYKWPDNSEVICPAVTFPATINMVIESGLKPVLCDVTMSDGMIDCQSLERRITKKTKAVCLVHLWGTPYPRLDELLKICGEYGLSIIEDSCETISRAVGHLGDVSCFSMYFNHIVSAGVGGMACTNDKKLEQIMRSLANHGMIDTAIKPKYKRFNFCRVGYSSRITELEAALGVAQFESIDNTLAYRQQLRSTITDEFIKQGVLNVELVGGTMMYPLLLDKGINRDKVMLELDKRGVETRTALPITDQSVFKYLGQFPNATQWNKRGLFLPIHPYMKKEHCQYAVKVFAEAVQCC